MNAEMANCTTTVPLVVWLRAVTVNLDNPTIFDTAEFSADGPVLHFASLEGSIHAVSIGDAKSDSDPTDAPKFGGAKL